MTEVTLFKEIQPSVKSHGYPTQTVNGIQLPGQEPVFFHKRFRTQSFADRLRELKDGRTTEVITLDPEAAKRLGKFCIDYLRCEAGSDDFNCKSFTDYVSGFSDEVEPVSTYHRHHHVSDISNPVDTLEEVSLILPSRMAKRDMQ